MAIISGDAVWGLNVGHYRVFVGVQQALIQTVCHLMVLLHWMVVVVEARHLHHSNAVVLRVNVQVLSKSGAVIIELVAIHRKSNDQEQKKNDANDRQDRRVSGRQEIVVHNVVIDYNVAVSIAVRPKYAIKASRFCGTERN